MHITIGFIIIVVSGLRILGSACREKPGKIRVFRHGATAGVQGLHRVLVQTPRSFESVIIAVTSMEQGVFLEGMSR